MYTVAFSTLLLLGACPFFMHGPRQIWRKGIPAVSEEKGLSIETTGDHQRQHQQRQMIPTFGRCSLWNGYLYFWVWVPAPGAGCIFFFFWQGGLGFLEEEERSREGKLPKAHSVQNKYHGFKSHNCRSHYWVVLFRSRSLKVEDVLPVPPDLIFNELLNWSLEKNQNKLPNSWLAGDPQSSF